LIDSIFLPFHFIYYTLFPLYFRLSIPLTGSWMLMLIKKREVLSSLLFSVRYSLLFRLHFHWVKSVIVHVVACDNNEIDNTMFNCIYLYMLCDWSKCDVRSWGIASNVCLQKLLILIDYCRCKCKRESTDQALLMHVWFS
jgi:hypothetical protein